MNRPFRGGGAGYNVGTGFAEGAQNLFSNALAGVRTGMDMKYADIAQQRQNVWNRSQAMSEEELRGSRSPAVLVGNAGGQGMPVGGDDAPLQFEDDPQVGAQALATQQPVHGPPDPRKPSELSIDDLRALAFDRGQQAKRSALANQNDMESLQKAYHYNALMKQILPHKQRLEGFLAQARSDPKNPRALRGVQVWSGEEDPDKAFAMVSDEYNKIREQYENYAQSYSPLNDYLTKRGITGDMYDDEAKFIQFMNQKQFMPHSPSAGKIPRARTPMPRQGR